MYQFNYIKAQSIEEASNALSNNPEAKILAGGMTLIPTMKQRLASPEQLIDIRQIEELKFIKIESNNIVVGSVSSHFEVSSSEIINENLPVLSKLAEGIGDPHVRNMGTIGGSISNNDPTADYPAACIGLGATIKTSKREVSSDEFFVDLFETILDEDEIVTQVSFPIIKNACYMKFPNPASRYAMAGVFISKSDQEIRVAVTGAGEKGVFRWKEMEDALHNDWSIKSAESISLTSDGVMSDIHGNSDYRANLVNIMAIRAVENLTNVR
jgi:carbon-monoxide dehydrogenase medium subunit